MSPKDQSLLERMTDVAISMGEIVTTINTGRHDVGLKPVDLHEMGERLRVLGEDLRSRADEAADEARLRRVRLVVCRQASDSTEARELLKMLGIHPGTRPTDSPPIDPARTGAVGEP